MAYANGKIPYSAMTALSTGGYLLAAAAAAFETWRIQAARAGYDLRPTSASDTFRPYDVQERIFRDRYRAGNLRGRPGFTSDVRYWPGHGYWTRRTGTAAAAVPGTSNHGKALAVDISNAGAFGRPYHSWMSRTGPALGWTNTEGRSVGEPWHWVHSGAWTVSNPISGGGSVTTPNIPGAPAPIDPKEWDEMATKQEVTDAVVDALLNYRIDGRNFFDWAKQGFADDQKIIAGINGLKTDVANVPSRTVLEVRVDGRNVIDWLKQDRAEQAAGFAALSGQAPASLDTAGLAKAIASQLPDDLARQVADELANRLKG